MNVQFNLAKSRPKGDVYLLTKKDRLQRLENMKQKISHTKPKQVKPRSIDQKKESGKQALKNPENKNPEAVSQNKKIERKNSQVSIVQDFEQPNCKLFNSTQNYIINVSHCPTLNEENKLSTEDNTSKYASTVPKQRQTMDSDMTRKYKYFKQFFQYLMDFKTLKIQSYNPKHQETSHPRLDESLSPRGKRGSNSLKVHFSDKEAEKNPKPQQNLTFANLHNQLSKSQQNKKQLNQTTDLLRSRQLQPRRKQIQTSQISLVDVRISNFFNGRIQSHQKLAANELSQTNNPPKSKLKVYFDSEKNKDVNFFDIDQQPSPISQSQNFAQMLYKSQSRIITLDQLKKKIENTKNEKQIHQGYYCDECKLQPILGKRYRCIQCEQYDLCEKCYQEHCFKFRMIMGKYNQNKVQNQHKHKENCLLLQMKPVLRKQMSDIVQESVYSQNFNSEEDVKNSQESQPNATSSQHVHLMEQVQKPPPKTTINLQRILRQTNRCSKDCVVMNESKTGDKNFRNRSPTPHWGRDSKLTHTIGSSMPRLFYSQHNITGTLMKSNRKILQSSRKQVEGLKQVTTQFRNIFTPS